MQPGDTAQRTPPRALLPALGWAAAAIGAALVAGDRWRWAAVAQWREDQATNLWLGFAQPFRDLPVGLMSSRLVPNPNGMPLLGAVLSWLPDALWVSWVLAMVQAALSVALCASLSAPTWARISAAAVLLASVLLRGTSVEFTNHWAILTSLQLVVAISVVWYLRRPTPFWIPVWVLCALAAPAIYLAGVANSVAIAATALALVVRYPPRAPARSWWAAAAASVLLVGVALAITWIPYFAHIDGIGSILQSSGAGSWAPRLRAVLGNALRSPVWYFSPWLTSKSLVIPQADPVLATSTTTATTLLSSGALVAQWGVFLCALAALVWAAARRPQDARARHPGLREVAWLAAMVTCVYVVAPLLGAPRWIKGDRIDQAVAFVPYLLVVWFVGPSVLPPSRLRRVLNAATVGIAAVFVVLNVALGESVLSGCRSYRGGISDADVSLSEKMKAVDFIASDWRASGGSDVVPVDYVLGGGKWDWVGDFGRHLERWYPAPMTIGRVLDFDLRRRYGLRNYEEGQPRTRREGRYVVSYAFEPPPPCAIPGVRHVTFERLRVTVVPAHPSGARVQ
jgi:hypothetical protein